jgi:hypothetical protein
LLALPVTILLGPVSAFNLLIRLAVVCSAGAMWAFLRTLCASRRACVIGACCYGFGPYLATEIQGDAHLDLAFVAIPPLLAWGALVLLRGTARPRAVACAIGLLGGAQVLIAPEVLSDLVIVAGVGAAIALVVAPRRTATNARRLLVPALVAASVFVLVAGYPLGYAIWGPHHLVGPVQQTAYLQPYAADLLGPIVPSTHQLLAPPSLAAASARFADGNTTENLAYLSLPLLVLLGYVAFRLRRLRPLLGALGLAAVAFVCSLGAHLTIDGHPTGVPLPESVLAHLPLLNSTVPARFGLDVALFVAVALAIGLDRLWLPAAAGTAFARRPWRRDAGWVVALGLCAAALLPARVSSGVVPELGPVTGLLGSVPQDAVLLTYPFAKTPNTAPMLWQAVDGLRLRLVGGYATVNGPEHAGVATAPLLSPPSVQEFLTEQQEGGAFFYPPIAATAATSADLCAFIVRYNVTAIIDVDRGTSEDQAVRDYFTRALGTPVVTVGDVALYRPNGGCGTGS